ncbi:Alpha/Beta hydrolase protein [Apodospora peruviana]|uniref:Alpha/Beta hydrolase protein n=1 Tax=Apodospora peruviana TaxID=516989 RepID=A0AAE0I4H7_9PEZI|nr:Alpha/Beta hydrolase protein [Apodospora peruviana]
MHTGYHTRIGSAAIVPTPPSKPIISFSPVVLPDAPNRPVPLELRVTVPSTASGPLPVILLSHGHGPSNWLSSLEGYAPLAEFWAAHGFAVIQPTHLSSAFLGLPSPSGEELFYKQRAADMVHILDSLHTIETSLIVVGHKLDSTRVAVAGHSLGAWTACMLLGASNTDPRDSSVHHNPEPRIKAGVVLAGIGAGGADLSEFGRTTLAPFYGGNFTTMTAPALVVYGDEDVAPHLTIRGADWHADSYTLAPGPKALLTIKGGKHGLGGVSGWDAKETEDESPERLAVVQRMTWAYLWSRLYEGDKAWEEACKAMEQLDRLGGVQAKEE